MINNDDKFSQIRKGLLEFVVLKIIKKTKVYAADILEILSQTDFASQEGTLYPMLSRLKREGMVAYEWVESEAGPPRKYYFLTTIGLEHLNSLAKYWRELNKTISQL